MPSQPHARPPAQRPRSGAAQPFARLPRLLTAALLGALVFAAGSGFGRDARIADPLPDQFDRLLVAAGLGINEVSLGGHRYANDSEIFAALGLDRAGSVIGFDVGAARRRIERLAWVETATITRRLPDRLRIEIVERRPAAVWEHAGRTALVDGNGQVLAYLAGGNLPVLPRIAGVGAPEAASRLFADLQGLPRVGEQVVRAVRVGGRRWTLELAGGAIVHLPAEGARDALRHLDRQHGVAGAEVIDLRLERMVVLQAIPGQRADAGLRTVRE